MYYVGVDLHKKSFSLCVVELEVVSWARRLLKPPPAKVYVYPQLELANILTKKF